MLETLFVISTIVLGLMFVLLRRERATGLKYASSVRAKLDLKTEHTAAAMHHAWVSSLHFVERNILLKGLHMVTYLALVYVRFAERKLVQLSQKLRSFRRDHHVLRRSTHKLTQWNATDAPETQGEQDR